MGLRDPFTGLGVGDKTGKSASAAQAKSSASARISGQDQGDTPRKRTSGSPPVTGKDNQKAERQEAASTQAVERGHQVAMIEVPDEEDDTAYQQWVAKGSPIVTPIRPVAVLPTPPDSPIQIR